MPENKFPLFVVTGCLPWRHAYEIAAVSHSAGHRGKRTHVLVKCRTCGSTEKFLLRSYYRQDELEPLENIEHHRKSAHVRRLVAKHLKKIRRDTLSTGTKK